MSSFRVYFYSLTTRKELTDCPLNGKTWLGTSGNVLKAGEFQKGTATFVDIANYADLGTVKGERRITAADFDEPVCFKVWHGPAAKPDWRKLEAA